ncbi:hypothetical protein [Streptomyces rimosus]|uniref:hypothetical protein n=1 Tax=Streptomyces rimosus TaxID=1927 RepID=UPI00379D7C1A
MDDRDLPGWDALTLLTAFPWLPQAAGSTAQHLRVRTEHLLDEVQLSARVRREKGYVHYV